MWWTRLLRACGAAAAGVDVVTLVARAVVAAKAAAAAKIRTLAAADAATAAVATPVAVANAAASRAAAAAAAIVAAVAVPGRLLRPAARRLPALPGHAAACSVAAVADATATMQPMRRRCGLRPVCADYDYSACGNCNRGCCPGRCCCGCCETYSGCCCQPQGPGCCASGDHQYNFAPGPPVGQTAYPYYTVRGPRDFLLKNPPRSARIDPSSSRVVLDLGSNEHNGSRLSHSRERNHASPAARARMRPGGWFCLQRENGRKSQGIMNIASNAATYALLGAETRQLPNAQNSAAYEFVSLESRNTHST